MIAVVDVHFGRGKATTACVLLRNWPDSRPADIGLSVVAGGGPQPSAPFGERELAPLLLLLRQLASPYHVVVVNGHVWLDSAGTPGLGALLHRALPNGIPVIGIVREGSHSAPYSRPAFRGSCEHPLYVSAAGMTPDTAAAAVVSMHGRCRIPTILRLADHLSRHEGIDLAAARERLLSPHADQDLPRYLGFDDPLSFRVHPAAAAERRAEVPTPGYRWRWVY